MKVMLLIGTGGFIGSVLRYLASQYIQVRHLTSFPYGTLTVNVVGCFLIGLLFGLTLKGNLSSEWRMFLATGVCGGFTTFSAFSNETIELMREEQVLIAIAYVFASVLLGLSATFIGIALTKLF